MSKEEDAESIVSLGTSRPSKPIKINCQVDLDTISQQSDPLATIKDNHCETYLSQLNDELYKNGIRRKVQALANAESRVFYINHDHKNSTWLPPSEAWSSLEKSLPYGWELAADKDGQSYFINHLNKTTTYEDPRKDEDDQPPEPRTCTLSRDSELGFGFVAGSERPVLVRFVKEGGPSEGLLQSGDHILKINGEDVCNAPREHVIELVKSCKHSVTMTVCQPHTNNSARKSAILTAAKKAKLRNNPSRVRFAEGVILNESPLCPSTPFLPNVLKVFLENGQTKTFKYDSTTCIQDVLNSLIEKLSIKCPNYFSLCVEQIKSSRRNKLTILDPKDAPARIAARPGSHSLRCLLRVTFVPKDAGALYQLDPIAFDYLYVQTVNDVVNERFSPELKYDLALKLSALHLHQHAISSGFLTSAGKVNLKAIEKEHGLGPFIPVSLIESMKRKELHKLVGHFVKSNQALCPSGQKTLTALQAKVNYLRIISELPSFGAKLFSTNVRDSPVESAIMVSPKYGLCHVGGMRGHTPIALGRIEEISSIKMTRDDDDMYYNVEIQQKSPGTGQESGGPLRFVLEEKDADEFVVAIQGYHRLLTSGQGSSPRKEIPVFKDTIDPWWSDSAPSYHGHHLVKETPWAYVPALSGCQFRRIDLTVPPPRYTHVTPAPNSDIMSTTSSSTMSSLNGIICAPAKNKMDADGSLVSLVDHNMNLNNSSMDISVEGSNGSNCSSSITANSSDDDHSRVFQEQNGAGLELPSIISTEHLETKPEHHDGRVRDGDIVQRVTEMNQIVTDAQNYLAASNFRARPLPSRTEARDPLSSSNILPEQMSQWSGDSDQLDTELAEGHTQLKAADSLLLLTSLDDSHLNGSIQVPVTTEQFGVKEAINVDLLDDEEDSDTEDSSNCTPNSSPVHQTTGLNQRPSGLSLVIPTTNIDQATTLGGHFDSKALLASFGIQSPEQMPNLSDTENELIEVLKNIQDGDEALQFAQHTMYSESDIIDLTSLPPPATPDDDDRMVKFPANSTSILINQTPPTPYRGDGDDVIGCFRKAQLDTSRVIADLDHLVDTLSDLKTPMTTTDHLPSNIDELIASLSVPPPPPNSNPPRTPFVARKRMTSGQRAKLDLGHEEDIYASLIIPPPPSLTATIDHSQEDDVIAKFWRATDDVKKMCLSSNVVLNNVQVDLNLSASRQDVPSPRTGIREVHSSSSGDSGYESIVSSSEWPVSNSEGSSSNNGHPGGRHGMPTLQESSPNNDSDKISSIMSTDGRDVPATPIGKPPKAPKPPLPPGSPSIAERRKQIAFEKANQSRRSSSDSNQSNQFSGDTKCDSIVGSEIPSVSHVTFDYEQIRDDLDQLFCQSQKDIDLLLSRLEEVHENRLHKLTNQQHDGDQSKLTKSRDHLVHETKLFASSSKAFVKCSTQGSPEVLNHLVDCVGQLDRMSELSEVLILSVRSQAQVTCVIDRLKEVAANYAYTVDTVHKLTESNFRTGNDDPGQSPYIGLLMTHATSLANSLAAMMGTLNSLV